MGIVSPVSFLEMVGATAATVSGIALMLAATLDKHVPFARSEARVAAPITNDELRITNGNDSLKSTTAAKWTVMTVVTVLTGFLGRVVSRLGGGKLADPQVLGPVVILIGNCLARFTVETWSWQAFGGALIVALVTWAFGEQQGRYQMARLNLERRALELRERADERLGG